MEKENKIAQATQVFRKMLVEEFGIKSTEHFHSIEGEDLAIIYENIKAEQENFNLTDKETQTILDVISGELDAQNANNKQQINLINVTLPDISSIEQITRIEEIKKQLVKRATGFTTGGFKPTNSNTECWIGRVYLYREDEDIPIDDNGAIMFPLLQICLEELPYVPDALKGTKVLTVFVSKNMPGRLAYNGNNWVIREYKEEDILVFKDICNNSSPITPYPLKSQLVNEDYPVWDSGDIPMDIEDELVKMEESGEITDYYDYTDCFSEHKIGGYPSYIQSGINFGDGYEFMLQIASDEKANLNIIDSGNFYLAKNSQTGDWRLYCDFY